MSLPENILRALHRPPVHRPHDHRPDPQVPLPQPEQPAPALAGEGCGEAPRAGCPLVSITHRRVRLLDVEAKYYACKDIIDGLRYAGLVRGDREGEIDLEVRQEKVAHFKDEETLISIHYHQP